MSDFLVIAITLFASLLLVATAYWADDIAWWLLDVTWEWRNRAWLDAVRTWKEGEKQGE